MGITTQEAGRLLGLKRRTVKDYCLRYRIGCKHGRDWSLSDEDLATIKAHMREKQA